MANIVTDYGAVGDGEYHLAVLTISAGSPNLSSTTAIFTAGIAGKSIAVGGAGASDTALMTTILSRTDSTHIVLNANAVTALAGVSRIVIWGTDNATFFDNFTAAEVGNTVSLTIPAGVYYIRSPDVLFEGISNLTIEGTGATLGFGSVGSIGVARGQFSNNTHHARTQTVAAGASSVSLVTPAEASRFTIGQYAMMTGIDLQANGFPSNHHFFEHKLVSNISGGTITFSTPLTNSYLSTWPHYNDGDANAPDYGGPATLYAMHSTWGGTMIVNGLTYVQHIQIGCVGRLCTFNDCTFVGNAAVTNSGPFPSQNEEWTLNNCDLTDCVMECDKYVKNITLSNVDIRTVSFQSSSIDSLTISNGSTLTLLLGSPKRVVAADSTITTFRPGAQNFGRTDSISLTNCAITNFPDTFLAVQDQGEGNNGINFSSGVSMANGVITFPNTYKTNGAIAWAVPGTLCFWSDLNGWFETNFRVVAVTQDASNTYVQTNLSGGFLTPPFGATEIWVNVHPCPAITVRGCTGADSLTGLNDAPAGRPWGSYYVSTYTSGADHATAQGDYFTIGKLARLSINVTHAYAGAGTLTFSPGTNFAVIKSDNSILQFYEVTVDAKTAGERIVTIGGANPAIGADSFGTLPSPQAWFTGSPNVGPKFSTDVSGTDPNVSVTLTWELEQFAETVQGYGGRMGVFVSTY